MNQSIPLYLGQPDIVWTAWEAIGTISAVFLTMFLLLGNRLIKALCKPHIRTVIQDWKYIQPKFNEKMEGPFGPSELVDGRFGHFEFSLFVKNARYLWVFGDEVFNLVILWWLDTKEEGKWTYQGSIESISYIPTNESWLIKIEQKKITRMPMGKYKLILKYITCLNEKTIELGKQSIIFTIPSKQNRIDLSLN